MVNGEFNGEIAQTLLIPGLVRSGGRRSVALDNDTWAGPPPVRRNCPMPLGGTKRSIPFSAKQWAY